MTPFHEEQHVFRRAIQQDRHQKSIHHGAPVELSRTQQKLQLQRLFFLTNDKNYLDHPQNMKRLTKELERVNREYHNVRRYEDPIKESFKRLVEQHQHIFQPSRHNILETSISHWNNTNEASQSSSSSCNSISSKMSINSNNDSVYSDSTEKSSFLSRWFNNSSTSSTHEVSINSSKFQQPLHNHNGTATYSFHPTIANHINKRKTTRY